jgi:hypothetical protein
MQRREENEYTRGVVEKFVERITEAVCDFLEEWTPPEKEAPFDRPPSPWDGPQHPSRGA